MSDRQYLDPQLSSLLGRLRSRVRRYVVWDSLLALAAIVLLAFWVGLALDYLPVTVGGTEMPRLARGILLLIAAGLFIFIVAKLLIGRLNRDLPDDSLALLLERQHPKLGGRLVTAVQLNKTDRDGDSHSPVLLNRVHKEAAAAVDQVDTGRVFRSEPLARKAMVVVPLALGMIVFAVLSPTAFGRAAGRLTLLSDDPWPRRAELEMVGVEVPVVTAADDEMVEPELKEFQDLSVSLPKGSNPTLRIRAKADSAEVPVACTVYYWTDEGSKGQTNMRRVGRVVDGYQSFILDGPPFTGLTDSFTFSVRGLDDRLDGFRIEAVQPPAITEMLVQVRKPDYLRGASSGEFDTESKYQAGLRIPQGSDVTLVAKTSVPLGSADVALKTDQGDVKFDDVELVEDGGVRLNLQDFNVATTIRMVPKDQQGISAQAAYRYFMGVVVDEAPSLQLKLNGIGTAITPVARLPMESEAEDDYGVDQLTIFASPASETEESNDEQAATASPKMDRDGHSEAVIDLREVVAAGTLPEIVPGTVLNVFAEATDHYDLGDKHLTRSEIFPLQVVTADKLLAMLERRELGMRARLEQTIEETRNLRDSLDLMRRRTFAPDQPEPKDEAERTRNIQVRRIRVQQSGLQASKTSEELSGIATSLDDLLQEMVNNRVDSADRRERIGEGVRDPLKTIIAGSLANLQSQIKDVEKSVENSAQAEQKTKIAVKTAEEVLLKLTAVLDKMLDLESFNEILDLYRQLIEDQDSISKETKEEQKRKLLDLFKE